MKVLNAESKGGGESPFSNKFFNMVLMLISSGSPFLPPKDAQLPSRKFPSKLYSLCFVRPNNNSCFTFKYELVLTVALPPLTSPRPQPTPYHSYCINSRHHPCPLPDSEDSMNESKQKSQHIPQYHERSASQSLTSFSKKYFIFTLHLFLDSIWIRECGRHMTMVFMIDCQGVPAPCSFYYYPWIEVRLRENADWGVPDLHSSCSVLKSWEFKTFLGMCMATNVEIAYESEIQLLRRWKFQILQNIAR